MQISLKNKLLNALKSNKLNPEILGERNWYNYFIQINELVWSRNLWNGYETHVYSDEYKSEHLGSFRLGYDYCSKPFLEQNN
ncbi:MAG: hypothetical protein ABI554_11710 [Flavobacterium sp.]